MSLSPTWRWTLLALLGLAIAIGVAFIASELTSQRIGLASEPLRAGEELAPAQEGGLRDQGRGPRESTSTTTSEAPTTTTGTDDSGSASDDRGAAEDSSGSGSDDVSGSDGDRDEDDD